VSDFTISTRNQDEHALPPIRWIGSKVLVISSTPISVTLPSLKDGYAVVITPTVDVWMSVGGTATGVDGNDIVPAFVKWQEDAAGGSVISIATMNSGDTGHAVVRWA
jgi:hypothetical protein